MACDDSVRPDTGGSAPSVDLSALRPELADAVAALLTASDRLARLTPTDLEGPEATAVAAAAAWVASQQGVVGARMLPAVEADGRWALSSARSFPIWVARTHRVSVRAARQQVALGRALRDHLPATAAAAAAGEVTLEQAQTLARLAPTSDARRAALADPDSDCNEAFLVHEAKLRSVEDFTMLTRRWAAAADPDADDRGYVEACDREFLELARLGDGYHLAGWLTVEHGQCLATALEAVTPVPAADDERTTTQRRAQALADLARVGLDRGLVGTGRAVRPRINVHIDYPTLTALADAAAQADADRPTQGTLRGFSAAALTGTAGSGVASDSETATGATAGPQFEDGTPIPRVLLNRLACDSELNRIIFGPQSQVLDVGRSERTFTGPRRQALVARDRHCRYPTCTAPPPLCEGHHVGHWARDHGDTRVDNGILLCWYHHDLVHRRRIEIHRVDVRWVFVDRHGQQIRNGEAAA